MEIGDLTYKIRQCTNETCRFRFPAVEGKGDICPVCKTDTISFALPEVVHHQTAVSKPPNHHVEVLVDNVRSIYNVGSIFRTADGAGVRHIHLCGITATPDHPKLAKTALGADSQLRWTYHRNALDTAVSLKKEGYQLCALEETPQATSLFDVIFPSSKAPLLLIVGNENIGIDPAIITHCHNTVVLPMQGVKDSLNVSVAFGIAIYQLQFGAQYGNRKT